MKITSEDNICWINLECDCDSSGYLGFQMEIHVDIRHGLFDAKNVDVQFINLAEFVAEFDRFVMDRSLKPRLEGTYDTFLAFSASGNAITLQFCLGDAFCGRKTAYFHQSGEFEIPQDCLLQYLSGFQALLKQM